MRPARCLLAATALILGVSARSTAYQPRRPEPGGVFAHGVQVDNPTDEPRTVSARVRLRGDRFWGTGREHAVRGPWVEIPAQPIGAGESLEIPLQLTVPAESPLVLGFEIRHRGGALWHPAVGFRVALAEPEDPAPLPEPEGRTVPFRLLAGGILLEGDPPPAPGEDYRRVAGSVARDAGEWDALRERIGLLSPDSWGLFPVEADDPGPEFRRVEWAAARPPDLEEETILALLAQPTGPGEEALGLHVRSVSAQRDGTLVCRHVYRLRRGNGLGYQLDGPGHWVLVAIPRTDAPIEFRRVR